MAEILVPTGEHSMLGPSGAKRWMNCPGSVNASREVKDDESIYAASGSVTHYLSELARKQGRFAIDWLGDTFVCGKYKFEIDEARVESAQEFMDWCAENPGEVLVEERIDFSEFVPQSTTDAYGKLFGTLDDARLNDGIVDVTDLKDGVGVQEFAEWNPQLLLQALGVLNAYGYLYDIKGFNLRICQPRLGHKDSWYISKDDLLSFAERLPAYTRAVEAGVEFAAGTWCKFCRLRKTCAVRANSMVQLMLNEGEFEDLDNLETHVKSAQGRLQLITNEQLAKILPALGEFAKWIKDVKARAIAALIAKEDVGGWKLVAGRAGRKWLSEVDAAVKLETLEVNPYKPSQVISVAVAEKALGKKEFAKRFKLEEDFRKPQGKPTLAPAGDKRPAMDASGVNEFEDLDEED